MAFQLSLVTVIMNLNDLDLESTLSLNGYADGFTVEDRSWSQAVSGGADGYVVETMTLLAFDTSQDNLAADLSALADVVRRVREQYEPGNNRFVYLRSQATYETYDRQAHVRNLVVGKASYTIGDNIDTQNRIMSIPLTIERGPWEAPLVTSLSGGSPVSKLGNTHDYAAASLGDVPGRPQLFSITTAGTVEAWVGYRGSRYGNPANYNPIYAWTAEGFSSGGSYGTDTTAAVDGTAYGGNRLQCSFATVTTMALRAHTSLGQLEPTNFVDYAGAHLILVRAKNSNIGTISMMRLVTGSANSFTQYSLAAHEPIKIFTDTWKLFALGILDTSHYAGNFAAYGNNVGFGIQAERVSGIGSLYFDVIGLVPYNEGFVYSRVPSGLLLNSLFSPIGGRVVFNSLAMGTGYSQMIPISPGTARQIYFANGAAGVELADTETSVVVDYYPRWLSLRGNEV